MIPPRRHPPQEENVDSWLMSYADMITLLMCFFIIFVSVSEPKKDKFSALTRGMADKFGMVDLATPFKSIVTSLQGVVENNRMFKDIAVESSSEGIEMELSARKFFQTGSAELNPATIPVLEELAQALTKIDFLTYRIAVEGYTSDIPFSSPIYPSNWELSSARAARLVRFFMQQGLKPEQLKAVGYGDGTPKVPNADGAGTPIPSNQERNERIVVKLERLG